MKRSVKIKEKALGRDHGDVAEGHEKLAELSRLAERDGLRIGE
jgi:hypothetical protein